MLGIFIIAMVATLDTVGLLTGSLAPYWPSVSRTAAPAKFWTIIGLCAVVVVANIITFITR